MRFRRVLLGVACRGARSVFFPSSSGQVKLRKILGKIRGERSRTIRTRDDDVKVPAILASIGGRLGRKTRAPEGTLDVGEAGRVEAVVGRVDGWVPFEIDIERATKLGGIAKRFAPWYVVIVKGVKTHVTVG